MSAQFISTYKAHKKGSHAEEIVWDVITESFKERECIAYWNYPIFLNSHCSRREPDILIIDKILGAIIIEVKGINIENIVSIQGHMWNYKDFYIPQGNPYEQAEKQMYSLMDWINEKKNLANKVSQRVLVALPYITKSEWEKSNFHLLPSNPPILFAEDFSSTETLVRKIESVFLYKHSSLLNDEEWDSLKELINGDKINQITEEVISDDPKYSFLYIASSEKELRGSKDLFKSYLQKGIKLFILYPDNYSEDLFDDLFFKEFREGYLLQCTHSSIDYKLTSPIKIIDGIGIDKNFEYTWLDKFPDFNKGQYKIEHAEANSNLMITAGAGTGKTTVMIQRIMFLLAMSPEMTLRDIVMITFTREASQEMKHRLKKELFIRQKLTKQPKYLHYAEELRDMQVSTIHSFAKLLIQELGFVLGFGQDVKLKSYTMKRREIIGIVLNDYVGDQKFNELGLDRFKHYEIIKIIESFWNEMESKGFSEKQIAELDWNIDSKENINKHLNNLFTQVFPQCETEFNKLKQLENAITIGDLIRKIRDISEKNPKVLAELSYKFKYLFVDEFQDSDDVQIQLVSQVNSVLDAKLFVVGDIKQSIYRFRGADYTAFEQLQRNVEEEFIQGIIQINYRTSKTLLAKLDSNYFKVWGENGHLTYTSKDKLIGVKDNYFKGDKELGIKKYYKQNEVEANVLTQVREAQDLIKKQNTGSNRKIALLVRTNNQAKTAYEWLDESGIPVQMNVGGTFYNSDTVKHFHSLLGALLYPMDSQNILNALATPYFDSETMLSELIEFKGSNEDIIKYLYDNHNLKEVFMNHVNDLRIKPVFSVVRKLLKQDILQCFYNRKMEMLSDEMREQQKDKIEFDLKKYHSNLNHLMNLLHQQFDSTNASLYSIYSWLGINIKTNREEDEPLVEDADSEDIIEIVTVHKSKGLEYHTVIMPFTNQLFNFERDEILFSDDKEKAGWFIKNSNIQNNIYNDLKSLESTEIVKEETRLLYVAMTRTRERLIILKRDSIVRDTWSAQLDV